MSHVVRPPHAGLLEDEIAALTLQREEIIDREGTKKAKYTLTNIPDLELLLRTSLPRSKFNCSF